MEVKNDQFYLQKKKTNTYSKNIDTLYEEVQNMVWEHLS
jgi:hypothetical protein